MPEKTCPADGWSYTVPPGAGVPKTISTFGQSHDLFKDYKGHWPPMTFKTVQSGVKALFFLARHFGRFFWRICELFSYCYKKYARLVKASTYHKHYILVLQWGSWIGLPPRIPRCLALKGKKPNHKALQSVNVQNLTVGNRNWPAQRNLLSRVAAWSSWRNSSPNSFMRKWLNNFMFFLRSKSTNAPDLTATLLTSRNKLGARGVWICICWPARGVAVWSK